MTIPKIIVEETPDPAMRDEILKPLRAYNESKLGPIKAEPLAITLRDADGAVTGGLWASSVVGWLFVDLLVVPEEFRSQGLGAELLQRAEDIARNRGCIGLWLHTGTFQAPGFYEKQGYTTFGTIPDYPLGHDTVYFMKRLA
ncbi:MAG: GNAT family N-acetyltransferase [Alphaproteobacteria bacterium]|nr:GNAT family N-acetyltransferase [Alphaproteobacteria bacterium]